MKAKPKFYITLACASGVHFPSFDFYICIFSNSPISLDKMKALLLNFVLFILVGK